MDRRNVKKPPMTASVQIVVATFCFSLPFSYKENNYCHIKEGFFNKYSEFLCRQKEVNTLFFDYKMKKINT